jgi:zinc transporter
MTPVSQSRPEDHGLVSAYVLDGKGGAREVSWPAIKAWRGNGDPIWIHLNRADETAQAWLLQEASLDAEAATALLAEDVRPRAEPIGKGLLINLRGINLNPGEDLEDMVAVRAYVEGPRIITTRQRRIMATDDLRLRFAQGMGPKDTMDCLLLLARSMLIRIGDVLGQLEDSVDELEDEVLSDRPKKLRDKLGVIRRRAIAIRRHLAPQRDALTRLSEETHALLDERDHAVLRELSDLTTRYVEDIDSVRERAAVVSEEWMNRVAESQQRNSYLLTVVAAIILPLTLVTSVLGVNVGGMNEGRVTQDFWLLVLILGGLALVQVVVFKLMRWL